MMTEDIVIFLLIGLARACAHMLQCPSCQGFIKGNCQFILETTIHVFGWPVEIFLYVFHQFKKRPPVITGSVVVNGNYAQRIDETEEDFHARVLADFAANLKNIKKDDNTNARK